MYIHICKLNELKIIRDLYSQYLTQTLSTTTSFTNPEGVFRANTYLKRRDTSCPQEFWRMTTVYPTTIIKLYNSH
jgi:hypothetical protein